MKIRILLFAALAAFCAAPVSGQNRDFQLWKGLILQKTFLNNKLQFSLNEEVRLHNNFSDVNSAFTDLSIHYKFIKSLAIGGGYRYNIKRDVNVHRVYGDLSWRPKFDMRFRFVLRTRYQYDMTPLEKEGVLRPRLNISYNIKDNPLEPYIGVEPFFNLGGDKDPGLSEVRFYAGVEYPIRKKVLLRLGYILSQELNSSDDEQNHILQVRIIVDLDRKEDSESDARIGW